MIGEIKQRLQTRSQVTYYCECTDPRIYRLTYNGGSSEIFSFECCQKCYDEEDKKFMIEQERIVGIN